MPTLNASSLPVPLGEAGYAIRTPGWRGQARLERAPDAATRARSRGADDGTADLDAAFAATGIAELRRIQLELAPAAPGVAGSLRGRAGEAAVELEVPDLGADVGQLVLASDEQGALTWHVPLDDTLAPQPPTTRGAGGVKRFRLPAAPAVPATGAPGAQRSLLGALGRKLLKVLVYPVTDPIVGAIGRGFAAAWEARHHPPLIRRFTPANRREPRAGAFTAADWSAMEAGRALLFVHGTFSSAHGAFDALPDAVFDTLYQRYGARLFAYDHPYLATDPVANARWFFAQVPADANLEVDIVCHSRGGLVSRLLAEPPRTGWRVRRLVFVAVPNQGTPLAEPNHMMAMIDRLTTALNLFPTGPVVETLEALITAVKVVGHGVLDGLPGLAAMKPGGPLLQTLNAGGSPDDSYRAVAVDFRPAGGGLASVIGQRVADRVMDLVFEDRPNDLVVPEAGVWSANGHAGFPIAPAHVLRVPAEAGVIHTTVFGHAPVGAALLDWLA